jgi:hypothetical protein
MYIERLNVHNLKCFDRASFDFNMPRWDSRAGVPERRLPNVNLLIGENGTGKTTTFQALAMSVLRVLLATSGAGFRTRYMIRYDEDSAEMSAKIWTSAMDTATSPEAEPFDHLTSHFANATIKRKGTTEYLETRGNAPNWSANLFMNAHPGLFVAAYGANRRTERPEAYDQRLRDVRYQRVASLFEPQAGLTPLSLAYAQCSAHRRWDEVVDIVNHLLQPPVKLMAASREGSEALQDSAEPLFDFDGVPLPAEALSDGYRIFVGWLMDFLTHLSRVWPKWRPLTDATGIVFVDEVDLFFAPNWQRTVLESLSSTFPRIQWFCSSHSPLVAGSLESENIFVLKKEGLHTSRPRRPTDEFEGKSVDEVLVDLFNVKQPRSPELQRQLSELADRAMEGDMEASLLYLRRLNEGTAKSARAK